MENTIIVAVIGLVGTLFGSIIEAYSGSSKSISDLRLDVKGIPQKHKNLTFTQNSGIMIIMNRKDNNQGIFSSISIPMQKRSLVRIAKKYNVDITGLTLKIQRDEALLNLPFLASTDYNNIGRIDFYPNAFTSEETLTKTLLHEKCHVKQLQRYGKAYCQDNLNEMEKQAYRFESIYYYILKRRSNHE